MPDNVYFGKGVTVLKESDPITVLPEGPFIHLHSTKDQQASYFVYPADAKLDLNFGGGANRHVSIYPHTLTGVRVYVSLTGKGAAQLKGGGDKATAWGCSVAGDSIPTCDQFPHGAEIFTSTGYVINSDGVRPCTDECFERMKQGLGRYYSLNDLLSGLNNLIASPDVDKDKKRRALYRLLKIGASESLPFLLERLGQERDPQALKGIVITIVGIYMSLLDFEPVVKEKYESEIREKISKLIQSSQQRDIKKVCEMALAKVLPGPSAPAEGQHDEQEESWTYELVLERLRSTDLRVQIDALFALGKLHGTRSLAILKQVISNEIPLSGESRGVAFFVTASLPYGEAADFLLNSLGKAKPESNEAADIAFAIQQIPVFLRTPDRIVKIHQLQTTYPSETEMIFKGWGISLETPVPDEVIKHYGPLPNPPDHPISLEWLAFQIDGMLEQRLSQQRGSETPCGCHTSVREAIGLQGILYPIYILLQGLQTEGLRNKIGKLLEEDFSDRLTEYGAIFRSSGQGVSLVVFPPKEWGNNYKYLASVAMDKATEEKGTLFRAHFHSLINSRMFAGPSSQGRGLGGDLWGYNQLVITRLRKGEFNIDWYDHFHGALDLGNYAYEVDE